MMNKPTNGARTAAGPTHRRADASLCGAVSLSPAPCRMIAVEVYRYDDGTHGVHWAPIVGILATVKMEYHKYVKANVPDPAPPATHGELIEAGWRPNGLGPEVHLNPVYIDLEYGLLEFGGVLDECDNRKHRAIVPCDWPPDPDRENAVRIGKALLAGTHEEERWAPLDPPGGEDRDR